MRSLTSGNPLRPRRIDPSWLLLVLLLVALFANPASAQIRGSVVDAAGRPVSGALVELWLEDRRVAGGQTDERGRFGLAPVEPERQAMLTVRRLGFQTQTVQLASSDTSLVVRMNPRPVVLEPLTVSATGQRACPNREDPRARALWERMRSRYWQPLSDSVFVFGFMELRSGVGDKSEVDRPEVGRVSSGWTIGSLVWANPALMARSGYASDASGGVGERTAFWLYRALDHGSMQDFTGDYFGSAHTFSIIGSGADQITLGFCPRERMRRTGQIEGRLVLHPDTTLNWARWSFRTPRPDEDAGGEASYYPPARELGSALLARETLFWRKTNGGRYYFESRMFSGWRPQDRRAGASRRGGTR